MMIFIFSCSKNKKDFLSLTLSQRSDWIMWSGGIQVKQRREYVYVANERVPRVEVGKWTRIWALVGLGVKQW